MLYKRQTEPPPKGATRIQLNKRVFVLVDPDDYARLSQYHWRLIRGASCFYAARRYIRKGKTTTIRMHREIMHTPAGYECHHKNRRPLDCRKSNLENLTPAEHRFKHQKV